MGTTNQYFFINSFIFIYELKILRKQTYLLSHSEICRMTGQALQHSTGAIITRPPCP